MNDHDALQRLLGADEALDAAAEKLRRQIEEEMICQVRMGVAESVMAEAGSAMTAARSDERDIHQRVMYVDKQTYAWLNTTAKEVEARARVCTPGGLRGLFPGLPRVTR